MSSRQAFIAEVAINFKHSLKATDDQALQIQLWCHTQKHGLVEGIVKGLEGTRRGTTGNQLHHRRFHFHKVALIQVVANKVDNLGAQTKHIARVFVDD